MNGVSKGGWAEYARFIQEAGADALELNLYYIPTDPALSAADVESAQVELVDGGQGEPVHPAGGEAQPVLHLPAATSRND